MPAVKHDVVEPAIANYAAAHSTQPDARQRDLIAQTAALGELARLQIGGDQGVLMELLARLGGARRAIEIGTFTGYSALCLVRGMGTEGRLICCDVNREWTAMAEEAWRAAGIADQIDLRIGPALDTLRALPNDETFDLAFIDADKPNYLNYYEALVPRLRRGGLVMIDNTLWKGRVLDTSDRSAETLAIRQVNDRVATDDRVMVAMLTVGDGLTLALKR